MGLGVAFEEWLRPFLPRPPAPRPPPRSRTVRTSSAETEAETGGETEPYPKPEPEPEPHPNQAADKIDSEELERRKQAAPKQAPAEPAEFDPCQALTLPLPLSPTQTQTQAGGCRVPRVSGARRGLRRVHRRGPGPSGCEGGL